MVAIEPMADDFALVDLVNDLVSVFLGGSCEDCQLKVLR